MKEIFIEVSMVMEKVWGEEWDSLNIDQQLHVANDFLWSLIENLPSEYSVLGKSYWFSVAENLKENIFAGNLSSYADTLIVGYTLSDKVWFIDRNESDLYE